MLVEFSSTLPNTSHDIGAQTDREVRKTGNDFVLGSANIRPLPRTWSRVLADLSWCLDLFAFDLGYFQTRSHLFIAWPTHKAVLYLSLFSQFTAWFNESKINASQPSQLMTEGCDDFWILVVINRLLIKLLTHFHLTVSLCHLSLNSSSHSAPFSNFTTLRLINAELCARVQKRASLSFRHRFRRHWRLLACCICSLDYWLSIFWCTVILIFDPPSSPSFWSLRRSHNATATCHLMAVSLPPPPPFLSSLITLFHTWVEPSRRASKARTEWVDTSSRIHTSIEIADCGVGERESDRTLFHSRVCQMKLMVFCCWKVPWLPLPNVTCV